MHQPPPGLYARLGAMLALEYFVFGTWKPTMGLVMSQNGLGDKIGLVFIFAAIAAMISPLFVGALADRFFPAQKVFGVLHLAGGALLVLMPQAIVNREGALFVLLLFLFMLFFQPTQAMPNSISFAHLQGRMHVFPYLRALGTGSWIIAGIVVGQGGLSAHPAIFYIAATVSFALGLYSFTLPSTPPLSKGRSFRPLDMIGAGAFPLFRQRKFVVLIACILLTFIPASTYNDYGATYLDAAGVHNVASIMSIGQAAEFVVMLLLPRLLVKFGFRKILVTGALTWILRCVLFLTLTHGQVWLAVTVVALHGVTTDFFMVTIYMYVDRMVAPALRSQAQALVFFFQLGVGSLLGAVAASSIYNSVIGNATTSDLSDWQPIWLVAAAAAVLNALLMVVFLGRDDPDQEQPGGPGAVSQDPQGAGKSPHATEAPGVAGGSDEEDAAPTDAGGSASAPLR